METPSNGSGPHHLRIAEFPQPLIEATDALFKSYAWRGDIDTLCRKAQKWSDAAAAVYNIDAPTIRIRSNNSRIRGGCGIYNRESNLIVLPKMSVISLFHFFRYALQALSPIELLPAAFGGDRHTEDAAAFSTSLFHTVRPELFRDAVQRPDLRVLFVRQTDLQAA